MATSSKTITEKQEVGTQLDTEADGEGDSFARPETAPLGLKRLPTAAAVARQQFTVQIRDRFGTTIDLGDKGRPEDCEQPREDHGSAVRVAARKQIRPSQSEAKFSSARVVRPKTSQGPVRPSPKASRFQPPPLPLHRATVSEAPAMIQSFVREASEAKTVMESLHKRFARVSIGKPRDVHSEAGVRTEEQAFRSGGERTAGEGRTEERTEGRTGEEGMREATMIVRPRTEGKRWTSADWMRSSSQALITQPILLIRGLSFSATHSKAATPQTTSPLHSPSGAQLSIPTLLSTRERLSDTSRLRPFLSYNGTQDWVSIGAHPATVKDLSTGRSQPNFVLKTDCEKPRRPTTVLLRSSVRQEAMICSGVFRGAKLLSMKHPGVPFLKAHKARPSPNHFLTGRPAVSSRARAKKVTEPPSTSILDLLLN